MGKKYGKLLPHIGKYLAETDGAALVRTMKADGVVRFQVDGAPVELFPDDILTQTVERAGFVTAADQGITVVLDSNLTPALEEEGNVRELISKLQTMRKEAGFEVQDRIRVTYAGSAEMTGVLERNRDAICRDVLALSAAPGPAGYVKTWNINGQEMTLGVEKQ